MTYEHALSRATQKVPTFRLRNRLGLHRYDPGEAAVGQEPAAPRLVAHLASPSAPDRSRQMVSLKKLMPRGDNVDAQLPLASIRGDPLGLSFRAVSFRLWITTVQALRGTRQFIIFAICSPRSILGDTSVKGVEMAVLKLIAELFLSQPRKRSVIRHFASIRRLPS
jgi:hypothetical protein